MSCTGLGTFMPDWPGFVAQHRVWSQGAGQRCKGLPAAEWSSAKPCDDHVSYCVNHTIIMIMRFMLPIISIWSSSDAALRTNWHSALVLQLTQLTLDD
jgi:hypothetical protein